MQNFSKIGQLPAELWPKKTIFNMAAVRHLEFKNSYFWSCDCRFVHNLLMYAKFQQNRIFHEDMAF